LLPDDDLNRIVEKYDNEGFVTEYHYQWMLLISEKGARLSHISAWENAQ